MIRTAKVLLTTPGPNVSVPFVAVKSAGAVASPFTVRKLTDTVPAEPFVRTTVINAFVAPSFTVKFALAKPTIPGAMSSSMIVNTAVPGAPTAALPVGFSNARFTVSLASTVRSGMIVTCTVCDATPGANTSVFVMPT